MMKTTEQNFVITPKELKQELDHGQSPVMIDVRSPEEYEGWHIPGSRNIPLHDFTEEAFSFLPTGKEIITICLHGIRSEKARQALAQKGYHAKSLQGGMVAWNSVYDVCEVPGRSQISLLQFRRIGKGCLSYMVMGEHEAVVIDPNADIQIYRDESEKRGVKIVAVLDTHLHADHVSGGSALARQTDARYVAPHQPDQHRSDKA